jgi:hypothetical protein
MTHRLLRRGFRRLKPRGLYLERLEDRRLLNGSPVWAAVPASLAADWSAALAADAWPPAAAHKETGPGAAKAAQFQPLLFINPALDSGGAPGFKGLGSFVSAWTHEGIHGGDLAALIHALQGKYDTSGGQGNGDQGGTLGGDQGGMSFGGTFDFFGVGQAQSPYVAMTDSPAPVGGDSKRPPEDAGGLTGSTPALTRVKTVTASEPPAPVETAPAPDTPAADAGPAPAPPAPAAGPAPASPAPADSAAPAEAGPRTPAQGPVAPANVAVPAAVVFVAPRPGREAVPTTGETQGGGRGEPPAAVPGVARVVAPAADTVTGGSALSDGALALARRTDNGAGVLEAVPPATDRPVAPPTADLAPAITGGADAARPGGADETAAPAPAREADLLTDLPAAELGGLGLSLRQAAQRVGDLLGDLAGSSVARRVAPWVTAVVLGGAAYGVVRRRRKKRARGAPGPAGAAKDTDTWLPGPSGLPPTDQP